MSQSNERREKQLDKIMLEVEQVIIFWSLFEENEKARAELIREFRTAIDSALPGNKPLPKEPK